MSLDRMSGPDRIEWADVRWIGASSSCHLTFFDGTTTLGTLSIRDDVLAMLRSRQDWEQKISILEHGKRVSPAEARAALPAFSAVTWDEQATATSMGNLQLRGRGGDLSFRLFVPRASDAEPASEEEKAAGLAYLTRLRDLIWG